MPLKQLHNEVLADGYETAKHHGPEGRNDLQINRTTSSLEAGTSLLKFY